MHNNQSENRLAMVSDNVERVALELDEIIADATDHDGCIISGAWKLHREQYAKDIIATMRPTDSALIAENAKLQEALTLAARWFHLNAEATPQPSDAFKRDLKRMENHCLESIRQALTATKES